MSPRERFDPGAALLKLVVIVIVAALHESHVRIRSSTSALRGASIDCSASITLRRRRIRSTVLFRDGVRRISRKVKIQHLHDMFFLLLWLRSAISGNAAIACWPPAKDGTICEEASGILIVALDEIHIHIDAQVDPEPKWIIWINRLELQTRACDGVIKLQEWIRRLPV